MGNDGSKEGTDGHITPHPGSIADLIGGGYINFNPMRDIYNVTFTFPVESKPDITRYIKKHGKGGLVQMILEEVSRCQDAAVK